MIRIGVHSEEKMTVQVVGRLGEEDIVELGAQLRQRALPGTPHRAVLHLEGLQAVRSTNPKGGSVKGIGLKGRRFTRIALVGDRRFEKAVRRLISRLVHGEIRYFGLGQSAQARRWLERPGLGSPPQRLLPARL